MGDLAAVSWLREMKAKLEAFRAHMKVVGPKIASRFNTFNYLRNDEYGMSRIIADLLDPSGDHAQGDVFLRAFLERFWPSQSLSSTGDKPVVGLEVTTRNRRRLDIQVKFNGGQAVLGIENKIWCAPDQENQVKDYLEHVWQECGKVNGAAGSYLLIYLTPDCQEPSAKSLGVSSKKSDEKREFFERHREHLLMLGCRDLVEWLRDCVGRCESVRVQAFLNDLVLFIRSAVLGVSDVNEQELIVNAVMESKEDMSAALKIADAAPVIKHGNFHRFLKELEKRVDGMEGKPDGWGLYTSGESETVANFRVMFGRIPKLYDDYVIQLQFDGTYMKRAYVGVASGKHHDGSLNGVKEALNKSVTEGREWPHWPWGVKFEHPYHEDWGGLEVQRLLWDTSGDCMAAKVAAKFKQILKAIQDTNPALLEKFRRS